MHNKLQNNPSIPLSIRYVPLAELKASEYNARIHPPAQIKALAKSIDTFGFLIPILIGPDNTVIAGHGRIEAAKQLRVSEVPTISIDHLTPAQQRAYRVADNRLTELAEWDSNVLGKEFAFLMTVPDLDMTITGFDIPKIDLLIQGIKEEPDEPEDESLLELKPLVVTKPKDCWVLGDHIIFCGDSLNEESYQRVLEGEMAQQVITDPPYNVPINRHVCGSGKIQHSEFQMASGEMTKVEFTQFLYQVFNLMSHYSKSGSIHHIFMDWRHIEEITEAANKVYAGLKNICVWNKDNGGMGSLYRSKHEFVFVYKHGDEPHINNIELGKHGRYRTNVWDYAGQNSLHSNRHTELAMHPTVKPVEMLADAMLDCSYHGGIILDPFGGSGSTLLAAEKTGRKARLIEIEPCYVDVTIRRWQAMTGKQAFNAVTCETFDDLEMEVENV